MGLSLLSFLCLPLSVFGLYIFHKLHFHFMLTHIWFLPCVQSGILLVGPVWSPSGSLDSACWHHIDCFSDLALTKKSSGYNLTSQVAWLQELGMPQQRCFYSVCNQLVPYIFLKTYFIIIIFKVSSTPNVGLELMTLRSRVTCSTDWASQAPWLVPY